VCACKTSMYKGWLLWDDYLKVSYWFAVVLAVRLNDARG
jgi:hypothetical protein